MSQRNGSGKPVAIGRKLPKSLIATFRKRGFARFEIVTRWPEIVGPELAACCQPEKLAWRRGEVAGATLLLRADRAVALKLQADWPRIRERINRFYGYRAVDRLKLVQGPIRPRQDRTRSRPAALPPGQRRQLEARLDGLADSPLKAALARLGESVLAPAAGPTAGRPGDTKA